MITAVPDVEYRELQEGDEFIIVACDGIWSVIYSPYYIDIANISNRFQVSYFLPLSSQKNN